jgi:hypothetical protein
MMEAVLSAESADTMQGCKHYWRRPEMCMQPVAVVERLCLPHSTHYLSDPRCNEFKALIPLLRTHKRVLYLSIKMPPKPKKVKETFNALGVTGGAPKFKQHVKSARKPTSWERKALKAAKSDQPEQSQSNPKMMAKAKPRAPDHHLAEKRPQATKSDFKRPQRRTDPSSGSSSSSAEDSSDDDSSSDEQIDLQPKSKGSSAAMPSKTKKAKKERIISITFEHFPVEERDFHGISVRAPSAPLTGCVIVCASARLCFFSPHSAGITV